MAKGFTVKQQMHPNIKKLLLRDFRSPLNEVRRLDASAYEDEFLNSLSEEDRKKLKQLAHGTGR
jgi:hypothetical protein